MIVPLKVRLGVVFQAGCLAIIAAIVAVHMAPDARAETFPPGPPDVNPAYVVVVAASSAPLVLSMVDYRRYSASWRPGSGR